MSLYLNIGTTAICLLVIAFYFNYREKKIQGIAGVKLKEIKDNYLDKLARRKLKEKQEIERLKKIVENLEKKHKEILTEKKKEVKKAWDKDAEDIIKKAEAKSKEIEDQAKIEVDKFMAEQKKEVQTKMVDLVMGVTKKVLARSIDYN